MAQYIVTLKQRDQLDSFYADMKSGGYTCVNKRPISRATHYDLTESQADTIAGDSRVLAVELHPDEDDRIEVGPDGYVNNTEVVQTGEFMKGSATNEMHRPWAQLHCSGNDAQRGKGVWTGVKTDTAKWYNDGKHVDVVICDDNCAYDCLDWYSTEDPTKNRFVQYDWYANHNAQVIGGIDDDGYSSPGTNYAEYFPNQGHTEYHGHHVTGTVAGKFYGWATEANIYNIQVLSGMGTALSPMLAFDYLRAFHNYKSINPETGHRNPTITNHSWSYRYDYGETYSSGLQIGDISNIQFNGKIYDSTNPNKSGWTMAGVEQDFGVGQWKLKIPIYYTSIAADIEDAIEDGVVVIGAAGNTDFYVANNSNHPYWNNYVNLVTYGIRYYNRGSSPANAPGAISVGSLDSDTDFTKSYFSNYGEAIDVWAPGSSVVSVYNSSGTLDAKYGGYNYYKTIQGTSMASPQVCGVAALLASGKERFTNSDLKGFLQNYCKDDDMTMYTVTTANSRATSFPLNVTHSTSGWTVTGPDRYTDHNAATNPIIEIFEGDTVEFILGLTIPAHPFHVTQFKVDGLLGTGDVPHGQVSWFLHQGTTSGTLDCTPPTGSAGDYYYVCGDTTSGHQSQHSVGWPQGILRVHPPLHFDDSNVTAGSVNKYLLSANPRPLADGFPSRWYQQQLKGRRRDEEILSPNPMPMQLYPRENVYHRGLGIHQQKSSNIVEDSYVIWTNHNNGWGDHEGMGRIWATNDEFKTIKDLGSTGNLNDPFRGRIMLPNGKGYHQGYWGGAYLYDSKQLTMNDSNDGTNTIASPYGGWNHITYDSVTGNLIVSTWGSASRIMWSTDLGLNWQSNAVGTSPNNNWADWDQLHNTATNASGEAIYPHGLVSMNGITILCGSFQYGNPSVRGSIVFRSTDGGVSWTETYHHGSGQAMHKTGGVYADPVAGVFRWYLAYNEDGINFPGTHVGGSQGVYESTDGVTWTWAGYTTLAPYGSYGSDQGFINYSVKDNRYYFMPSSYRNVTTFRRSVAANNALEFEDVTPNIGAWWKISDMVMSRDGDPLLFCIRKLDTAWGSTITTDGGVICKVVKFCVATEQITELQQFHIGGHDNANGASYHYHGDYNFMLGYNTMFYN